MTPTSRAPSRQNITRFPEKPDKGKGTSAKGKPLADMGGHSVSTAAGRGASAIASAKQNTGATKAGGYEDTLLNLNQETRQQAARKVTAAMSVSKTDDKQMQLQCESEIVDKLEKLVTDRGSESANDARKDEMLARISAANQLKDDGDLSAANEALAHVFKHVDKHMGIVDNSVISALCRSKAHILCREQDIESALRFFQLSDKFANPVNFHDRLTVLYLRLGTNMGMENGSLSLFQPDAFYKDIQKWLVSDERHQTGLAEFIRQAPQAKTFYDGIKAIFEEKKVDLAGDKFLDSWFEGEVTSMANPHWKSVQEMFEKDARDEAIKKFQGIIKQLIEQEEQQKQQRTNISSPSPLPLTSSCYVLLLFAKSLQLIEQGYYHEARETIIQYRLHEYRHLSTYIYCQIASNEGRIDQAIALCEHGVDAGEPLRDYLAELHAQKAASVAITGCHADRKKAWPSEIHSSPNGW